MTPLLSEVNVDEVLLRERVAVSATSDPIPASGGRGHYAGPVKVAAMRSTLSGPIEKHIKLPRERINSHLHFEEVDLISGAGAF